MDSVLANILPYLQGRVEKALNVQNVANVQITKIGGGDYNLNYHLAFSDGRHFLMRLNVEPQSGLNNQIEYEYKTLEFLVPHHIAPRPYFLDSSKEHFSYDLLIEEYIPGPTLSFSKDALKRTAETLATLHTISLPTKGFIRRNNPLREQYETTRNSLSLYEVRTTANRELIAFGKQILNKAEIDLGKNEQDFTPRSLVHTDLVPSNFIDTGSRVYLLDWEKGRIDDPSYDLAVFLSPLANLWDSPRVLTEEEKSTFLETYMAETGDSAIQDRVQKRTGLFTLAGTLWAAGRICDVVEGVMNKNLGTGNMERYKRIIDFGELKKYI